MTACNCGLELLNILPHIKGGTQLRWYLSSGVTIGVGATVTIAVSRHATSANAAWTTLATVPVSDGSYVDASQRTWGASEQVYYRITLSNPVCTLGPYPSMMGSIPCELRGNMREILRREYLSQRTKEKQRGLLLKRKLSGTECTTCLDPDRPGVTLRSDCPTCFMTGWVGGYYANPDFYMAAGAYRRGAMRSEDLPVVTGNEPSVFSFLNIPDVQPLDVWVDYQSDHRWEIDTVEATTRIGSYVIIATATARRLKFNDIVYQIPVTKP